MLKQEHEMMQRDLKHKAANFSDTASTWFQLHFKVLQTARESKYTRKIRVLRRGTHIRSGMHSDWYPLFTKYSLGNGRCKGLPKWLQTLPGRASLSIYACTSQLHYKVAQAFTGFNIALSHKDTAGWYLWIATNWRCVRKYLIQLQNTVLQEKSWKAFS